MTYIVEYNRYHTYIKKKKKKRLEASRARLIFQLCSQYYISPSL